MIWFNLIHFLISIEAISGVIIYLGKKILDKLLESGVEKYKNELNITLETHKNKLQLEHHKFTKLHVEQCEVIRGIYKKIQKLSFLLNDFLVLIKENRRLERFDFENTIMPCITASMECEEYFKENEILLSENLSNKVNSTIKLISTQTNKLNQTILVKFPELFSPTQLTELHNMYEKIGNYSSIELDELDIIVSNIEKIINTDFKESSKMLTEEFRRIYGVIEA